MTQITNLDSRVREQLRNKILNGDLGGGYHLSELKISKEFNVSRTPVREALCALAADGLVEMIPHRGAFVRQGVSASKEDQATTFGYLMGVASRFATEKSTIETVMDLETGLSFLNDSQNQNAAGFNAAVGSLLGLIRQSAQSPTLEDAISLIDRRSDATKSFNNAFKQREEVQKGFALLIGAMKRRKPDTAEKTMREIMTTLTGQSVGSDTAAHVPATAETRTRATA